MRRRPLAVKRRGREQGLRGRVLMQQARADRGAAGRHEVRRYRLHECGRVGWVVEQ